MEALLEARDPEYRELFEPSLHKLREMKATGQLKAVHAQIGKITRYVTGTQEEAPAKSILVPVDVPHTPFFDFPLLGQTEQKPPTKPNAFTFMKTAEASLPTKEQPKEEAKPNLFANLSLKTTPPPPKAPVQSSFSFLNKEAEKKSGLQGLDLDFATTSIPPPKASDALASLNFDAAFEPVQDKPFNSSQTFLPTPTTQQVPSYNMQAKPQMMGSQMYYNAGARPQMPLQQFYNSPVRPLRPPQLPSYAKEESEASKVNDDYFAFVNDEL
eukprot:TRINITY_DN4508_c0_g1_i5.p1 TRINITY_DN4508_c0_g1~~TRINITY_DN4508_c0_g1_i5.p1  ORF type:complete len:270 (+),score=76.71 TRINITY_DN4508_c0_g1_i5:713-1522(+)